MVNDRAKQFGAFSPLRGYHEMLKAKERVIVPKRELTEESAEELSLKLGRLEKGRIAKVIHYVDGEYLATEGIVSRIDFCFKSLTIVKTEIRFDDIYDVELQ